MGDMSKVPDARLKHVFTEAVLDQLVANGADVNRQLSLKCDDMFSHLGD